VTEDHYEGQRKQPLVFHPYDALFAAGMNHKVLLLPTETGEVVQEINLKPKGVYALAFSPDGNWLAVGSADKKIRLWSMEV
jgi:WD40 repeat protein